MKKRLRKAAVHHPPDVVTTHIEQKHDSLDPDIGGYVKPLLGSISQLKIEKIDLTTQKGAKEALPHLDALLSKLKTYKRTSSALRTMLEAKDKKTAMRTENKDES